MSEFPVATSDLYVQSPVDGTLSDGELIDCGRTRIEVIHTPGHTAGHCSVFLPEEEVLFAGDTHTLAGMRLIYAMHPSHFVIFWEKCMIEKHLVRLEKAGLAETSDEGLWYPV